MALLNSRDLLALDLHWMGEPYAQILAYALAGGLDEAFMGEPFFGVRAVGSDTMHVQWFGI